MTGIILSFAFIVIAVILLWILIGAKGPWLAKLLLIALVPAYGIVIFITSQHDESRARGWPTKEVTPPEKGVLLWGTIREPGDLGHGDPGSITVWLIPLDDSGKEAGEPLGTPRSYRLPYSRGLHGAVQSGMERSKAGRPGILQRGKPGHGRQGHRSGGGYGEHDNAGEYRSYDFPPSAERKGAPE